jgi:hypothetical protein
VVMRGCRHESGVNGNLREGMTERKEKQKLGEGGVGAGLGGGGASAKE